MSTFIADPKDPQDILFHDQVVRAWLKEGETIAEVEVLSNKPELVVDQVVDADGVVSYRVSGGVAGQVYLVSCRVLTSTGRRARRSVRYTVKNL